VPRRATTPAQRRGAIPGTAGASVHPAQTRTSWRNLRGD
jgi:hypothetical protein